MDMDKFFFDTCKMPNSWKAAFITLMPKVKAPTTTKDYRPISLCNVTYKIVTKILVNMLKLILSKVKSHEQSASVSGRLISDNALAAQEIFHSMGYRNDESNMMAI